MGGTSFIKDFFCATWRCRATERAQWKPDGCLGKNKGKVLVITKLSFCELTEYDTKGSGGIQSSDYLMVEIEFFLAGSLQVWFNLYRENHLVDNLII